MITPKLIKAARALAGWTTAELGKRTSLTADTITNIENGKTQPRGGSLELIAAAFQQEGIEFTHNGVKFEDTIRLLEGENTYLRMLEDILHSTSKGGEVLFFCSDDKSTTPNEVEMEQLIRNNGILFRCLIEEGNTHIRWPKDEYRTIPSEHFNHNLQVIYGHTVAQVIDGGKQIMIIKNHSIATTARNIFNLLWANMKPVGKSRG